MQIFAQLIELRAKPLPAVYMQIFPPLLSPVFWERSGNIPALVRLIQVHARCYPCSKTLPYPTHPLQTDHLPQIWLPGPLMPSLPPPRPLNWASLSLRNPSLLLCVLLRPQAYLTKAGEEVVGGGHLLPLLGVFQKLIASKAHDHEGFEVRGGGR